jgi:hypothetical protein
MAPPLPSLSGPPPASPQALMYRPRVLPPLVPLAQHFSPKAPRRNPFGYLWRESPSRKGAAQDGIASCFQFSGVPWNEMEAATGATARASRRLSETAAQPWQVVVT